MTDPIVSTRYRRTLLISVVVIAGAVAAFNWAPSDWLPSWMLSIPASVPGCADAPITKLAKGAIEQSPLGQTLHYAVYNLRDEKQTAYDADADKRTCVATALTNTGEQELKYTVEWADKSHGQVYVTAQILVDAQPEASGRQLVPEEVINLALIQPAPLSRQHGATRRHGQTDHRPLCAPLDRRYRHRSAVLRSDRATVGRADRRRMRGIGQLLRSPS
jgi:hypothetical protein